MELIFHGLGFFLTHHFKKTVIAIVAIIVLCGGAIYVAMDFARMKYKVEEIAPMGAKP